MTTPHELVRASSRGDFLAAVVASTVHGPLCSAAIFAVALEELCVVGDLSRSGLKTRRMRPGDLHGGGVAVVAARDCDAPARRARAATSLTAATISVSPTPALGALELLRAGARRGWRAGTPRRANLANSVAELERSLERLEERLAP